MQRLPVKYRSPMVLCYLEGRTNEDAARQLQWPVGTVKVRLMRGREMLRTRLARRGLALSGAALTAIPSQDAASAALPPTLADTTIRAALVFTAGKAAGAGAVSAHAVALTEGVLKTMYWNKLKIVVGVLLTAGLLASGAGWLTYHAVAGDGEPPKAQAAPEASGKEAKRDNKSNEPKKVPSELEKALVNAAKETCQGYLREVEVGKIIPDETTCLWSARWLEAQLALTKEKGDQVAAFRAHRDRMKELEKAHPVVFRCRENRTETLLDHQVLSTGCRAKASAGGGGEVVGKCSRMRSRTRSKGLDQAAYFVRGSSFS
jgi:hypothetical protein